MENTGYIKDLKAAGYNGSLGIRGVRREAEA